MEVSQRGRGIDLEVYWDVFSIIRGTMAQKTFFRQLFIPLMALFLASLFLYSTITLGLVREEMMGDAIELQMITTQVLINLVEGEPPQNQEELVKKSVQTLPLQITLMDREGGVLMAINREEEGAGDPATYPEFQRALLQGKGSSVRSSINSGQTLLYTAIAQGDYILRVAQSIDFLNQQLRRAYLQLLGLFFLVLLLGVLGASIIARRFSAILLKTQHVLQSFTKGSFETRLDLPRTRDGENLSRAVNTMGRQLQEKISTISLQRSELKEILDSMAEPVLLLNYRLEVRTLNPAARNLLDLGEDPPLPKGLLQLMPSLETCSLAEKILEEGRGQEGAVYYAPKDCYFQINGTPLWGREGAPPSILLVLTDISVMKRGEKMRKEFVANVSHELKSPITSIIGYVETLQGGDCQDREQEFLQTIYKQSLHLNSIIDDLLALSKIEGEQSSFPMDSFPLAPLFEELTLSFAPRCQDHQTTLNWDCPPDLMAQAHRGLIRQTIANLISNGLKYCPPGGNINMQGRREARELVIRVQDKGPGISQEYQERVFERFYRIDKARCREVGGTGLGLAIVKHTVELHQGSIALESQPGEGCVFTIRLPQESAKGV